MVELDRLDELEKQLEGLKDREDLVGAEKKRLARSIRRRIRKLKAALQEMNESEEVEDGKEVDLGSEKFTAPKRRRKRKSGKTWNLNKEQVQTYMDGLLVQMSLLIPRDDSVINKDHLPGYGFAQAHIIDQAEQDGISPEDMAQLLHDKFRKRWGEFLDRDEEIPTPQWWSLQMQGEQALIFLGPVKVQEWRDD